MNNSTQAYLKLTGRKIKMSSKLQLNLFKTVSRHLNPLLGERKRAKINLRWRTPHMLQESHLTSQRRYEKVIHLKAPSNG